MTTGLRPEEKEAIRNNYVPLLNSLKVGLDDVINLLYQWGLFTDSVKEDIECRSTPREKAGELLRVVNNTDNPWVFYVFTKALKETRHQHIAKVLQDEARAAKQDTVQQVRDSQQPPRQGNVSDECSTGRATACFCQKTSQPSSSSALLTEDVGSTSPQFSSQTLVKKHVSYPNPLTRQDARRSRESIEAGTESSQENHLGGSLSVEIRPVEGMQSVDEETSQPPLVSLKATETASMFPNSAPEDLSDRLSNREQLAERMQVDEESEPHSVPNNFLSNISVVSNVTTLAAEPRVPATNSHLQQQQPQAHQFKVKLQREPDKSFGFKIVSGLRNKRARYVGDSDYYITKLYPHTIGARCGLLQEKDTIVSVNDVRIKNMLLNDVVKIFKNSVQIVMIIKR